MSVVTLNLGQCGNQVGQELLNVVSNDAFNARKNCPGVQGKTYYACALDRFFREEQTGGIFFNRHGFVKKIIVIKL